MIRTIVGEARNEPYLGQVAVAATILNRARIGTFGGHEIRGVVAKHKQFEPWTRHCWRLVHIRPGSETWNTAARAVAEAQVGNDPTQGATHFANVATVLKRGNMAAMRWIKALQNVITIGRHTFGRMGPIQPPETPPI